MSGRSFTITWGEYDAFYVERTEDVLKFQLGSLAMTFWHNLDTNAALNYSVKEIQRLRTENKELRKERAAA